MFLSDFVLWKHSTSRGRVLGTALWTSTKLCARKPMMKPAITMNIDCLSFSEIGVISFL